MNKILCDKLPRIDKLEYSVKYNMLLIMLLYLCLALLIISFAGLFLLSKRLLFSGGIMACIDVILYVWGFSKLLCYYDNITSKYLEKFKYGGK